MTDYVPLTFQDMPANTTPVRNLELAYIQTQYALAKAYADGQLLSFVGKGSLVLHVADYGAKGDGATDDTTSLRAAFTASRAVGAALQFGFGLTYIVSGSLNPTGVDVRGFGATLKVKAGTTPSYSGVFGPTAAFGLQDLMIDLNKANTIDPAVNTQGNGIYLNNATGWSGIATVRNVEVINGYQCGIRFSTASSLTDGSAAPLSRVLIDNPVVDSTKYGIFLSQTRGVTITNPTVNATAADGIFDFLSRDTQITGGRITATGGHGVITQYSYGASCQGVAVDAATGLGIVVGGGSVTNVEAKNFTIVGNRVSGCTLSGISVDTTKTGFPGVVVPSYSTIAGNVSRGSGVHGIYVHNGKYVSVTGNTCQGNANGGLAMDSKCVAVAGNTFVENAYGIKFQGTASGFGSHQMAPNVVEANTVSDYYFDSHGADNTTLGLQGSGSPEAVVAAPIGSRFSRVDGGAGTTLYVKESGGTGNTGWVGK